jgi:hypothetical protein
MLKSIPEGFSEKVADVTFKCTGLAPSGGLTGDVLVRNSSSVANLLLSTVQTDVLLLEVP